KTRAWPILRLGLDASGLSKIFRVELRTEGRAVRATWVSDTRHTREEREQTTACTRSRRTNHLAVDLPGLPSTGTAVIATVVACPSPTTARLISRVTRVSLGLLARALSSELLCRRTST